jgi:plasmid stability protein
MSTNELPVQLPDDLYLALKALAAHSERSINDITIEALRSHLTHEDRRAGIDAAADNIRSRYRVALDRLGE